MIYTLTLNPAIDYVMHIDELKKGEIMRSNKQSVLFGGKGINVSQVLSQLREKNVALGFAAGFTGMAICEGIKNEFTVPDFVFLKEGLSRINVKLRADEETDINCAGPEINKDDLKGLFEKLENIKSGDTLILAGSVPKSLSKDIYAQILSKVEGKGVITVVDAEKDYLLNCLKYKPFLIKPNKEELEALFNKKIEGIEEILSAAKELWNMGAQNVLVSLGSDGALLLDESGCVHKRESFKGEVLNTVGAGDSMVAGFVKGFLDSRDFDFALKLGSACGSATAFSVGLASIDKINELLEL